jgi:hypothetical protein
MKGNETAVKNASAKKCFFISNCEPIKCEYERREDGREKDEEKCFHIRIVSRSNPSR